MYASNSYYALNITICARLYGIQLNSYTTIFNKK